MLHTRFLDHRRNADLTRESIKWQWGKEPFLSPIETRFHLCFDSHISGLLAPFPIID